MATTSRTRAPAAAEELTFDAADAPPKRKAPTRGKAAAPVAGTAAPAEPAALPAAADAPSAPAAAGRDPIVLAALALAVFASVIAVIATLAASRMLVRAATVIAAAETTHATAPDGAVAAELHRLANRQDALAARPVLAALPATGGGDLHAIENALDALRIDLANRTTGQGDTAVVAGLAQLGERIARLETRVSPTPRAACAAGRARPS